MQVHVQIKTLQTINEKTKPIEKATIMSEISASELVLQFLENTN